MSARACGFDSHLRHHEPPPPVYREPRKWTVIDARGREAGVVVAHEKARGPVTRDPGRW